MLSPRHEFSYRFHDALIAIPNIKNRYRFMNMGYHSNDEDVPDIRALGASGIITSITTDLVNTQTIVDYGIPVVNISLSQQEGFMSLFVDPNSTAEIIVRHAVGTCFQKIVHLTIAGMTGQIYYQGDFLEKHAKKTNIDYQQYTTPLYPLGMTDPTWMAENQTFLNALSKEKKRTLYFTGYDSAAEHLLRLFSHLGISVPHQSGVLGRGNATSSRLSDPSISSIKWPWINLANSAIEMLEENKGDRRVPSGEVLIRESTVSASHSERQWVFKVADMIERYGYEGITVEKLAQYAQVSKSTLDRHYREFYGITPSSAIRKVQLKKARSLLRNSDMTIEGVAYSTGFNSVRSFFRAFEAEYNTTPAAWRKAS